MLRKIVSSLLALLLSACGVFNQQDVPATLEAQNAAYTTEVAALPATVAVESTRMAVTVAAANTHTAEVQSINQQLLGTVAVGQTATLARVAGVAPEVRVEGDTGEPMEQMETPGAAPIAASGDTQLAQITTASSIRASDGCADVVQTRFSTSTERIYITAVALNLRAGQQISTLWYYAPSPNVVASLEWLVPQDYTELCIWFYISPAETPDLNLTPGNWLVQFTLNGQSLGSPATFTVE